ncbi:MAG: hypothetical protein ACLUJG_12610 [Lawsonibacter sp.]
MPTEYAIEMKGITKTFGSVVANRDVELTRADRGRSWPCWVRTARARPP